jgi:hypothetical protein
MTNSLGSYSVSTRKPEVLPLDHQLKPPLQNAYRLPERESVSVTFPKQSETTSATDAAFQIVLWTIPNYLSLPISPGGPIAPTCEGPLQTDYVFAHYTIGRSKLATLRCWTMAAFDSIPAAQRKATGLSRTLSLMPHDQSRSVTRPRLRKLCGCIVCALAWTNSDRESDGDAASHASHGPRPAARLIGNRGDLQREHAPILDGGDDAEECVPQLRRRVIRK